MKLLDVCDLNIYELMASYTDNIYEKVQYSNRSSLRSDTHRLPGIL